MELNVIAQKVTDALLEQKKTVSLAESCTGGMIAARLVSVSGISRYFYGAIVSYVNQMKEALLGVQQKTLESYTAVSREVAEEMAAGAQKKTGTDLAYSVTGLAGPLGGTPEIPIGRVFVGICEKGKPAYSLAFTLRGNRRQIRRAAAEAALSAILTHLEKI